MLNNVISQRGTFFILLAAHTDRLVAGASATLRLIPAWATRVTKPPS